VWRAALNCLQIGLNDGAKGYFVGVTEGAVLYESDWLIVRAASTPQLLAMKLAAWRDVVDREDAKLLLLQMTGLRQDVWSAVGPFVPPPDLNKAAYAFEDLWDSTHETD
jgi:hypothetical protein